MDERVLDLLEQCGQLNRVGRLKPENLVAGARRNKRAMLMLGLIAAVVAPGKLAGWGRLGGLSAAGDVNHLAVLRAGFVSDGELVRSRGKLAK